MVSDEVYGGVRLCCLEESECERMQGVVVVICGGRECVPYAGVEKGCVWWVGGYEVLETGCEVGVHAGAAVECLCLGNNPNISRRPSTHPRPCPLPKLS